MNTDELYRVAIHEAGHAVMSVICGRGLEYVSIEILEENTSGVCMCSEWYITQSNKRRKIRRTCMIAVAGAIAESDLGYTVDMKEDDFLGAITYDLESTFEIALELCGTEEKAMKFIEKLVSKVQNIFSDALVQLQIRAVADNLMEHKTLFGKNVKRIMMEVAA